MDVFIPIARGSYIKAGLCSKDIFREIGTEILLYGAWFQVTFTPNTPYLGFRQFYWRYTFSTFEGFRIRMNPYSVFFFFPKEPQSYSYGAFKTKTAILSLRRYITITGVFTPRRPIVRSIFVRVLEIRQTF